jgi:hypothetical protein
MVHSNLKCLKFDDFVKNLTVITGPDKNNRLQTVYLSASFFYDADKYKY